MSGNPLRMTEKTIEALEHIRKHGYVCLDEDNKNNWYVPGNKEIKISDKSIFALYRRGIIDTFEVDQFTVGARLVKEAV